MNNYMDIFIKTKADYRDFIKEFYTNTKHMVVFKYRDSLWLGDYHSAARIPTVGLDWVEDLANKAAKFHNNKIVADDNYESDRDAKLSGAMSDSMVEAFSKLVDQADRRNKLKITPTGERLRNGDGYDLARLSYDDAKRREYKDDYNSKRGYVHPYVHMNRYAVGAFPKTFEFYAGDEFTRAQQSNAISIMYHHANESKPEVVAIKMPIVLRNLDDIEVIQTCSCCDGSGWEVVQ